MHFFRFKPSPLAVHYRDGRITIARPAPPAPPKPETLAELHARLRKLENDLLTAKGGDAAAWAVPPTDEIERDLALVDREIDRHLSAIGAN